MEIKLSKRYYKVYLRTRCTRFGYSRKSRASAASRDQAKSVMSVGNLRVQRQHLNDPAVRQFIEGARGGFQMHKVSDLLNAPVENPDATKQDEQDEWEDLSAHSIGAEQSPPKQVTPEEVKARQEATRKKVLERGLFAKLNYVCLPDVEESETKPSGRRQPSSANAFIDTTTMRANPFQLQNFEHGALDGLAEGERLLMTR
jgi:hypothetical protein